MINGVVDVQLIGDAKFAAQGVSEKFSGQAVQKQTFFLKKSILQAFYADELRAVDHLCGSVNRRVILSNPPLVAESFLVAPVTGSVKVFQSKPKRVDLVVAACALR